VNRCQGLDAWDILNVAVLWRETKMPGAPSWLLLHLHPERGRSFTPVNEHRSRGTLCSTLAPICCRSCRVPHFSRALCARGGKVQSVPSHCHPERGRSFTPVNEHRSRGTLCFLNAEPSPSPGSAECPILANKPLAPAHSKAARVGFHERLLPQPVFRGRFYCTVIPSEDARSRQ